jgi:hypothetical protein
MAYKLKCNTCGHVYIAARSYYACPRTHCEANYPTLIAEVVDVAVDVAVAYMVADVAGDVLSGIGDALGSMFD